MIEILLPCAATEHGANQPETAHDPLQLQCCCVGGCGGQHGEALKTRGVLGDGRGNQIVRLLRQVYAFFRVEVMQRGRHNGEHLHIDPALIHQRQALRSKVVETLFYLARSKFPVPSLPMEECAHAARIAGVRKCSSIAISFMVSLLSRCCCG